LYSFLKHGHRIRLALQRVFGFSNETMEDLVRVSILNARSVYISNIATGMIQSTLVATGAALTGIADWFMAFFLTLILSFVPVIGAAPVAFVCALIAYMKGETTHAIILLVVGLFTGMIDNILRPWLASTGESNTPPIIAFVCVLGGALWLGFPGLFIGLLVGSFSYDTLPIFWREIGRGDQSYVEEIAPES
jgi:predicted PurR-regulated permease PerM